MIFWIALILLLWIISIVFNDIEDSLAHHYKDSVFDWLPKHTWLSWYMQDPDSTWERKYNSFDNDSMEKFKNFAFDRIPPIDKEDDIKKLLRKGRKKWHGIIIPAVVFDGWHGAKIVRQFFQFLTIYVGVHSEVVFPFALGMLLFGISNYIIHSKLFYGGIFLKKWWK